MVGGVRTGDESGDDKAGIGGWQTNGRKSKDGGRLMVGRARTDEMDARYDMHHMWTRRILNLFMSRALSTQAALTPDREQPCSDSMAL
jgi:hypothetical protein